MDSDGGFLSIGCLDCLGSKLVHSGLPGRSDSRAADQPAESQEHAAPEGAQAGQIVLHLQQ